MSDHTIPGEFTRLEVKPASAGPVNPIETAHRALIVALGKMLVGRQVPKIWVNPEPDDFLAVKDYVAAVAAACDLWLQAVGKEARSNSLHTFDKSSFQSAFTDAVEGYALYELQAEAEELGDVDRDTRTAIQHGRTARAIIETIRGER